MCVDGIMVDRSPLTSAPDDGIVSSDIGFHPVVSSLWNDRIPFPVVGGMEGIIGVQGEIGGVTPVIINWIPISLRAGGIRRVQLRLFDDHLNSLGCWRCGNRHKQTKNKADQRQKSNQSRAY